MRGKTNRGLIAVVMGLVVTGCGNAGSTAPAASVAASTATPSSAASPKVVLRLYPYELPWPSDELERKWRYASIAWDGETRIDHGNASTDSVRTRDGELFAFGIETSGTAADLQERIAENAAREHGCDPDPVDEAALDAGGEAGIIAVHNCAGERVIRWFAVHDGFGLAVMLIVASDADPDVVRAHFEQHIAGLTWMF